MLWVIDNCLLYVICSYTFIFVFACGDITFTWVGNEDCEIREKARRTLLILLILLLAPITIPIVFICTMWWLIIQALGKKKDE
jgi:hypothetical protein